MQYAHGKRRHQTMASVNLHCKIIQTALWQRRWNPQTHYILLENYSKRANLMEHIHDNNNNKIKGYNLSNTQKPCPKESRSSHSKSDKIQLAQ